MYHPEELVVENSSAWYEAWSCCLLGKALADPWLKQQVLGMERHKEKLRSERGTKNKKKNQTKGGKLKRGWGEQKQSIVRKCSYQEKKAKRRLMLQ